VLPKLRTWSTRGTLVALGVVALALAGTVFAALHGVHCPECDRLALGDRYGAWRDFFAVKDAVWLAGLGLSVLSTPLATRRWPGVLGIIVGFFGVTVQPM
jgi:hypothetical protein